MVTIRLARGGAKKRPFFGIMVADQRRSPRGKFIERVGFFNPRAVGGEERLRIDTERVAYWISKGAQPSDRVNSLLKQFAKGPEALEAEKAVAEEAVAEEAVAEEVVAEEAVAEEAVAEEVVAEEAVAEEVVAEEAVAEEAVAEEASAEPKAE